MTNCNDKLPLGNLPHSQMNSLPKVLVQYIVLGSHRSPLLDSKMILCMEKLVNIPPKQIGLNPPLVSGLLTFTDESCPLILVITLIQELC